MIFLHTFTRICTLDIKLVSLLHGWNTVFLNKTVSDFPTITDPEQFPCKPNAITTQGSTYVSTIVYETEEVSSKCSCICSSKTNISIDELQEKLNEIKEDLAVTKTSLSSSQRKKICAQDERTSSTRIGILGLCVIIGILLVLVVSDIFNGVLYISKIQGKKKNRNIWHWTIQITEKIFLFNYAWKFYTYIHLCIIFCTVFLK